MNRMLIAVLVVSIAISLFVVWGIDGAVKKFYKFREYTAFWEGIFHEYWEEKGVCFEYEVPSEYSEEESLLFLLASWYVMEWNSGWVVAGDPEIITACPLDNFFKKESAERMGSWDG